MAPPLPISPVTARKTWRTLEPFHAMVYFAPEAREALAEVGLAPEQGYFASRSAPMGAVGPEVVVATFFNFNPDLVRSALPAAWQEASPEVVLEARFRGAERALRSLLGDAADAPDLARAAVLARAVAERSTDRPEGRPLFAAHAGLPWPERPLLVLWHAQTLLREFRGDGHVALLTTSDLDAVEALVLHVATGDVPEHLLRSTRGWGDDAWEAGVTRLVERGLAVRVDPNGRTGPAVELTGAGAALRNDIEDRTDELAVYPYEALGEEGCAELRTLARPFSRMVAEAALPT